MKAETSFSTRIRGFSTKACQKYTKKPHQTCEGLQIFTFIRFFAQNPLKYAPEYGNIISHGTQNKIFI